MKLRLTRCLSPAIVMIYMRCPHAYTVLWCRCRLCPRRLSVNKKRRSSSTNLVDLEEWAYREQVSTSWLRQLPLSCGLQLWHGQCMLRNAHISGGMSFADRAACAAYVDYDPFCSLSSSNECNHWRLQSRRSQIRDRSYRNRCFGLRLGIGPGPSWRGIRAALDGQGPVEIASDWVDADSGDEVTAFESCLSMCSLQQPPTLGQYTWRCFPMLS